jgi:hypothetical protein
MSFSESSCPSSCVCPGKYFGYFESALKIKVGPFACPLVAGSLKAVPAAISNESSVQQVR